MTPTVSRLACRNFRSYRALTLDFSSRFVVFFGQNGAGKTNILEAISLFSSDRGLRKASVADFSNFHSEPGTWNLELRLLESGYQTFLTTYLYNDRRVARIDGSSIQSLNKFEKLLWLLWITPGMDTLFIGPRSERRNFFDHLVSGYSSHYKSCLKTISDLQKERLHVIFFRKDERWLEILEERIAQASWQAAMTRLEFLQILSDTFSEYRSEFLRPNVSIEGVIENIVRNLGEENAILEIAERLKATRFTDSKKQSTEVSVFKSSWLARHPRTNLEAENCSTGEQKAFLISLILAVTRIYQQSKRGVSILLLDDLMMHLDKTRRRTLVDELKELNVQTFFTGTEAYLFDDLSNTAQMYHVENSICSFK